VTDGPVTDSLVTDGPVTDGPGTDSLVDGGSIRSNALVQRALGPAMVLCSSASIMVSAAVAVSVFDSVGVLATGGLRFLFAAMLLLALARPRLRGRSVLNWATLAGFGAVLAGLNLVFYSAIERIPLGTTATIEFLGPFLVSVIGARRLREGLWAVLAAAGVVLLAGPSADVNPTGLLLAGIGAVMLGGYVLLSRAVGEQSNGLDGLALSVSFAAVLTLPLSLPTLPHLDLRQAGIIAVSAAFGIALAFALEMQAIRWTSARTVSVLLSLDPAFGALAGLTLLGQRLSVPLFLGIGCVVLAGIGVTADSSRSSGAAMPDDVANAEPGGSGRSGGIAEPGGSGRSGGIAEPGATADQAATPLCTTTVN
jgi:inner membrane transporter RhtA